MVTGVGNATLYQENLVKGYLTIPKKPGVRPISIPHPLGWGGRTQFDLENKNFMALLTMKNTKNKVTIQPTQNQLIDIDFDITDKCD
jgi:hypothetical protein